MTNIKSTRKQDSIQERIINKFLYDYFFIKVNKTSRLITDRELQIAGVDLQLENTKGKTLNIDIKAQSSPKYINNPTPTFILELSSLDKLGEQRVGWFLNSEPITNYYSFVWIDTADVNIDGRITSPEDIHKVEIMTVSKEKLKEYIFKVLKNKDIDATVNKMRYTGNTKLPIVRGIHFSHTPSLFEKPVNLVVHKSILKNFSILHCCVTKDKILKYK